MDLQQIFYGVSIVFMVLLIFILLGIAVLMFYIGKKIGDIHDFIVLRINELTTFTFNPLQKTAAVASALFSKKKKDAAKTD